MKRFNTIAIALSIVLAALLLGRAYTYKYRAQETVVVTGLAEREFTSDLIVWRGWITAEAQEAAEGYKQIEQSKDKVFGNICVKVSVTYGVKNRIPQPHISVRQAIWC